MKEVVEELPLSHASGSARDFVRSALTMALPEASLGVKGVVAKLAFHKPAAQRAILCEARAIGYARNEPWVRAQGAHCKTV